MALEEAHETNAPAAPNSGVLTPRTAQNDHWTPETGNYYQTLSNPQH